MTAVPELVAHRGESGDYPENTLLAMERAFSAGARWIECDIQLSQDHCPMVLHDHLLDRTTSQTGYVWDNTAAQLVKMSAGYAARFGDRFQAQTIPRLHDLVALLQDWPDTHALVELKRASLRKFGAKVVLDAVMRELQPLRRRCLLISYDVEVLALARQQYQQAIGWVFDAVTETVKTTASQLQPELLITDAQQFAAEQLHQFPRGAWQWCLFEVNQPTLARQWASLGIHYIETNRIQGYCAQPDFFPGHED